MMTRDEKRQIFLNKNGWGQAERVLLAADASFRHYDRLTQNGQTIILMDAPEPENPKQFVMIDELLIQANLSVPKVYATDYDNGFVLLEDFGDDTFTRLITNGHNESDLYYQATNALVQLQKNIQSDLSQLPIYNEDKMLEEVSLLPLWFVKYVVGINLSSKEINEFTQIWQKIIQKIQKVPKTLVLLDYHIDNIMITKGGKCGFLDFQDARFGPVFYDLISLIEDARHPVSPKIQQQAIEYFLKAFPQYCDFYHQTAPLIAAQRHTKVIGIFIRLCVRDGKDRYLKFIPFVWTLLEKHLNHPDLADLKIWLDKYVPTHLRQSVPQVLPFSSTL